MKLRFWLKSPMGRQSLCTDRGSWKVSTSTEELPGGKHAAAVNTLFILNRLSLWLPEIQNKVMDSAGAFQNSLRHFTPAICQHTRPQIPYACGMLRKQHQNLSIDFLLWIRLTLALTFDWVSTYFFFDATSLVFSSWPTN